MGKWLRWVVAVVASAIISAVFQPMVEQQLEHLGWYSSPGVAAGFALNWIEQIVGVQAFPWVAAGALGLAAGAWLDTLARFVDRARGRDLVEAAEHIAGFNKRAARIMRSKGVVSGPVFASFYTETQAALAEIKRRGLRVPELALYEADDKAGEIQDYVSAVSAYFLTVGPYLSRGLLADAKREAVKVSAEIEQARG